MQLSKPKLFAAVLILLGLMAFLAWGFIFSSSPALSQREAATRVLAEYLQTTLRPRSVLVIGNPYSQTSGRPQNIYTFQNAAVEGLRQGFPPSTGMDIVFPALKPDALENPASIPVDSSSKTPLSFLVAENAFDNLTRQKPADVIISLIGLPVNLAVVESWTNPAPPRYALLLPDWRIIGPTEKILQAFTSGKLVAAVVDKPGAPSQENFSGKNFRTVFESTYILVTPENVEQLLSSQPQIFALR